MKYLYLMLVAAPMALLARQLGFSPILAILLIAGYLCSLLYTFWTHSSAFASSEGGPAVTVMPKWSSKRALVILLTAAAGAAVMAEVLVSVTEQAVKSLGLTEFFV